MHRRNSGQRTADSGQRTADSGQRTTDSGPADSGPADSGPADQRTSGQRTSGQRTADLRTADNGQRTCGQRTNGPTDQRTANKVEVYHSTCSDQHVQYMSFEIFLTSNKLLDYHTKRYIHAHSQVIANQNRSCLLYVTLTPDLKATQQLLHVRMHHITYFVKI